MYSGGSKQGALKFRSCIWQSHVTCTADTFKFDSVDLGAKEFFFFFFHW